MCREEIVCNILDAIIVLNINHVHIFCSLMGSDM